MSAKRAKIPKVVQIARKLSWGFDGRGETNIQVPLRDAETARHVTSISYFSAEDLIVWWGRPPNGKDHVEIMLGINYCGKKENPTVANSLIDHVAALEKHFEKISVVEDDSGLGHFEFTMSSGADPYKVIIEKCALVLRQFGIKAPTDHRLPQVEEHSFMRLGSGPLIPIRSYVQDLYKELPSR